MNKRLPSFEYERQLCQKYLLIGIDEVGRGALAGPVGVGAVCFDFSKQITDIEEIGINDSKKLKPHTRQQLVPIIKQRALSYSTAFTSVAEINRIGIVHAVNRAIRECVAAIQHDLKTSLPFYLLLDAFKVKNIPGIGLQHQTAIIKGDSISISIAAASILAKVERDAVMTDLSLQFPNYFWHKNKGYGTKDHIEAICQHGPSALHRNLFIRSILTSEHYQNTAKQLRTYQVLTK